MRATRLLVVALLFGAHDTSALNRLRCPESQLGEMQFIDAAVGTLGVNGSVVNPLRVVTIPAFCIDIRELTVRKFLVLANPRISNCPQVSSSSDQPMGCVTEIEADTVCRKLGKRLPTQDEWEFAAVGRNRAHYTHDTQGHELTAQMMRRHFGAASIHTAGGDPLDLSPFGVRDLGGNMAEWTSTSVGNNYVVRGGSFTHPQFDLFQASRVVAPMSEAPDIGFRCAATPF